MGGWTGDPKNSWWVQHCPSRPEDLTHKHDIHCTDGHGPTQCCECGQMSGEHIVYPTKPTPPPAPTWPNQRNNPADHVYVSTLAGRCGRCQRPSSEHMTFQEPDPLTGCTVKHDSITAKTMLDDGGLFWASCPECGVMVEPGFDIAKGKGPVGPAYGLGRGVLTDRLMKRLEGWAGWVKYNGGD